MVEQDLDIYPCILLPGVSSRLCSRKFMGWHVGSSRRGKSLFQTMDPDRKPNNLRRQAPSLRVPWVLVVSPQSWSQLGVAWVELPEFEVNSNSGEKSCNGVNYGCYRIWFAITVFGCEPH